MVMGSREDGGARGVAFGGQHHVRHPGPNPLSPGLGESAERGPQAAAFDQALDYLRGRLQEFRIFDWPAPVERVPATSPSASIAAAPALTAQALIALVAPATQPAPATAPAPAVLSAPAALLALAVLLVRGDRKTIPLGGEVLWKPKAAGQLSGSSLALYGAI